MGRFLRTLALLPPALLALLFAVQGALWLVNPARAVRFWGFPVPDGGLGLSSMIGGLASWCLTIAVCLLLALIRGQRFWYYPPMMMLGLFAIGRMVAGAVHGAPPLPERFIPELVFVVLLYLVARTTGARREA